MASFNYNINPAGPTPAPVQTEFELKPRSITPSATRVPVPQVPNVVPGGNITLNEFTAGGARPNTYGLYDPRGAANVRSAMPYQAAYTPGQYGSMGMRPMPSAALGAGEAMPLAIRPNAAPATIPFEAPAGAGMKPAQVLNVRTIPGTGGAAAADAVPLLEAGGAGAGRGAGIGSRAVGAAGTFGKTLPILGDVLQGAAYGMEKNSVGRGVAAGLGSLAGRIVGGAGGTLIAPGPGTIAGEIGGSLAGAAGVASLYDLATGNDTYKNPEAVRQALANLDNLAVPSRMDLPQGLMANTGGAGNAMRIDPPATGNTTPQISRQEPGLRGKYDIPYSAEPRPQTPATPARSSGFQPPSAEEMARFRRETGTDYDPKSINDKLNLERLRAGEETFNSKQANAYRRSNPDYRPGQYAKGSLSTARPSRIRPSASGPLRSDNSYGYRNSR